MVSKIHRQGNLPETQTTERNQMKILELKNYKEKSTIQITEFEQQTENRLKEMDRASGMTL